MSRPAQLTMGTGDAQVGLEYVKSRRVLRVRGRRDAGGAAMELPLQVVFDELGIDATDVAPACQYLLFAGVNGRVRGGSADVVRVLDSEEAARTAFRALRLQCGEDGWGELAALDTAGRMRRLCWFGTTSGFLDDDTHPVPSLDEPRRGPLGRMRYGARRRRETSEGDRVA